MPKHYTKNLKGSAKARSVKPRTAKPRKAKKK